MTKRPKSFTQIDYRAEDLLQAGIDHLNAAINLSDVSFRYFDSAGYLCHMGLELMIKALVLHRTGSFRGTHPLKDHINDLSNAGVSLELTKRQQQIFDYISSFSELRYPSLNHPVEIGTEDINLVEELAEVIWQQMPNELIEAYEAIPTHKKGSRVIMRRKKELPRNLEFENGITAE